MHHAKTWTLAVYLDEDERQTTARAELRTGDRILTGRGVARRRPTDSDIPEIGDELASARALTDLAHQLFEATVDDIEAATHRDAQLRG